MISKRIKIFSFCFFIIFFAYHGINQFLTVYFSNIGNVKVVFFSFVLNYSSLLVSNLFSGFLVSKIGLRKCLIFGSFFYSLFIFAVFSQSLFLFYLASILLGFGASLLWTAQGTFLVRFSDPTQYGRSSGFFSVILHIGSVLGILIFGFLINKISFQNSFLMFAFLPLIATIIFLWLEEKELPAVDLKEKLEQFKKMLKNTHVLRFSLSWFAFHLVIAAVFGQVPLGIKKYFNLSSIGTITPLFYFLPIVVSYYFGKKSDAKGRKNFLILAYILAATGFALFTVQSVFNLNKLFFILCFFLISLGSAIFVSLRFASVGDAASDGNLEYLTAITLLAGNAGSVLIFLINIYFSAAFSYFFSFILILLSLIIASPVLKLDIGTLKKEINGKN